jgi:hypothetical protein
VQYLGHIVSPEGITTDPQKLRAVREWRAPKIKHETKSFLGLCTQYRRIISGLSNIAKLLNRLMEEEQALQWTPDVGATFKTLKGALCTALFLFI